LRAEGFFPPPSAVEINVEIKNVPEECSLRHLLGETNGVFLMKFLMKGANVRNMMSTHTTFDSSQNTT
jgi:hypothetical protein